MEGREKGWEQIPEAISEPARKQRRDEAEEVVEDGYRLRDDPADDPEDRYDGRPDCETDIHQPTLPFPQINHKQNTHLFTLLSPINLVPRNARTQTYFAATCPLITPAITMVGMAIP